MIKAFKQKKHLGQHFLHDELVLDKIVELIAPKPSDHIVEIGPGKGALTTKILPAVNSMDAIEFDREVIPILEKNCKNYNKLHIHRANVLKIDFASFASPIRLIGNLPYNISTPILFKAIDNLKLIKDMHFMLQKEVAERITAPPNSKTYGRLSVIIQYYCDVELLLHIGSGAFSPPPKVDSTFIRLLPRKTHSIVAQDEKLLSDIIRDAFCQRRKIIANSLKKYLTASQLEEIGINPGLRPERLSVDDFVLISNKLSRPIKTS